MAKFAPVYMSAYDGPEYGPFVDLEISEDTVAAPLSQGDTIGAITGYANADDSRLFLVTATGAADDSGLFQIDEFDLEAGPNAANLEAGEYTVIVREDNPWVQGEFHDTTFTITVTSE